MLLTLRDVSLNLGSTVLLDRANFTLEKGERVAVLGRNGAGKSSMLKVIDGEYGLDGGDLIRAQSLRIARLVQDVPAGTDGKVFSVVAKGLGAAGALLSKYHELLEAERFDELGDVQVKIEAVDGWTLDQRVSETISRLDLPGDAIFSSLSGGMKRRVLLGQALVQQPDLLLLDEPTNHLDVESIAWLEDFLVSFQGAILFVTHDRAFLQRVATRILELDRGWLTSWPGDYENYLRRKEERAHAEAQERALFDKRLAQEEAWIRKGVEARRTRNQGRVERLYELRKQFSERRNAPGKANMLIQEADRSGKLVAEADNVAYSVAGPDGERTLVRGLSTTIIRGDKLGIIGPNGAGKTTLINLLLGRLQPKSGDLKLGSNLQIAYFDQLRGGLNENASVVDNLGDGKDFVEIGGARKHVMGYLQDFLFTPDRARSPVRALSGGERNRLLLARLFATPSNLLVLDEPTNDLDMETLELLEELLMDYEGTVLLVSHDRAFLDNVVTRCLVFEGAGRVNEYIGGYADWVRQRPAVVAKPAAPAGAKPSAAPAPVVAKLTIARSLNSKEKRELDELPRKIEKLEAEQATAAEELSRPGFYDQPKDQVLKVQKRLDDMAKTLATAYARWEELEALREA